MKSVPFIWETHGVHVGTGADHVKHGIDDLEAVVERCIGLGFPSLTFVIHTPRLTRFRYPNERALGIKFIRGDASYFTYTARMAELRRTYGERIQIRCGVELEWQGEGLGIQWNRAKLFQAHGVDFVVGSVHFAPDGIAYDASSEETARLIAARGGLELFWADYFDQVIEMIDASWRVLSVVGHIDLPRLFAPLPESLIRFDAGGGVAARRLLTALEMIAERNLALDVNLSGIRKGVGIFPRPEILRRAFSLGIPVALGSDCHDPESIGRHSEEGIRAVQAAGYRYYVSFSRGIPEKRPLGDESIGGEGAGAGGGAGAAQTAGAAGGATQDPDPDVATSMDAGFRVLNLGIEILNRRFAGERRLEIPRLSFGGGFRSLAKVFPESSSLGAFHAVRARKGERSITITDSAPAQDAGEIECLFSHHLDKPGTLALLLNTLASEEINVETAWLNALGDGTATAYLTLGGSRERAKEAAEFVLGTAREKFLRIEPSLRARLPSLRKAPAYLVEVDGVWLPIPVSPHMLITVHQNHPGVLLVLLSALASRNVNVIDLQLGARGEKGFAAIGIEGDERDVAEVLPLLGSPYTEASHVVMGSDRFRSF